MLAAVVRRHTHRGPFEAVPLPPGLPARLRRDAAAEGAALVTVSGGDARERLAEIAAAAGRRQDQDPASRAETERWSHEAGHPARDGVPARAFPRQAARRGPGFQPGRLPQRDFDLGRHVGLLPAGGPAGQLTAALCTAGDSWADWLRAGQALHRLLLDAATGWVFARLNTQPLEAEGTRALVRDALGRPGWPQVLLELGVCRVAYPTARRPSGTVIV